LNRHLVRLVESWRASGSPQQEGFDWTSRRNNWIEAFPRESKFISSLPDEIDRQAVRRICDSRKHNIREKFLAVMVWGYGDRGYGSYRVSKMLSQDHSEKILENVYEIAHSKKPKLAYAHLMENRINTLGPSYGSKFITFCTPREISAPIYDSLIALWINKNAKVEFSKISTSTAKWSLNTYSFYCDWIGEHSKELECYPDDVELVLFRDAEKQFAKRSSWLGK
jgi:hypothetical protein